jgi:hypothetical protein
MKKIYFLYSLLFFSSALAQETRFREWRFQLPAGWEMQQQSDTAVLIPSSAPAGSVYIKLFPAQAQTENLTNWLNQQAARDTQGTHILQSSQVTAFPVNRPSVLQKVVGTQEANGQKLVRLYVAESPIPGQAELFIFQAVLAQAGRYTSDMSAFAKSVHFSNTSSNTSTPASNPSTGSQPAPDASAGGASVQGSTSSPLFAGWYVRSMPRSVPGPNFTVTMKPSWEYYRFFPNGLVYTSLPETGNIDAISCPEAGIGEDRCETYSVRGSMITIGRSRPKTLEFVSANEIKLGGVATWRLRPLQTMPTGTYEAVAGGGGLGTAAIAITDITFYPNGSFSSSRSAGVNSTTAASSASAHRSSSVSGRYRLNGYDLELQDQTGRTTTTKVIAPADGDLGLLVIGNATYIRKEKP